MDNSIVVVDVDSACQAIDTVIDQGEGTRTEPLKVVGTGYAHYYRFAEIVNGGLLVPNPDAGPATPPDQRYVYDTVNHPLPFDATGVYGVPTNPAAYAPGSVGEVANDNFNYTYTSLLKVLHHAVNGEPKLLDSALGLMMSLRQQAMDMMSGPAPPTRTSDRHSSTNS
ncbi:MAG: ferritin-like domain-containing protein [Acidimicrobiales bacterium]